MHVWDVGAGPLQVEVGPLRPHVFEASLHLRDAKGMHRISGAQQNGMFLFNVSAKQVTEVLNKVAFLFVITKQAIHIGSPDLRWGWRYRLIQGPNNLSATDGVGTPLQLDQNGFFNSALEKFDETVETGRETIVFK